VKGCTNATEELAAMSSTVTLTGLLPFIVLVASGLAVPVSFALLRLYRSSVQKGMQSMGRGKRKTPPEPSHPHAPAAKLRVALFDDQSGREEERSQAPIWRRAAYGPWHASVAYAIAGLTYALVMVSGWLAATRDEVIVWNKVLLLLWTYYWPAVITILLMAAYDLRRRLQLFGAYFMILGVLIAFAVARNPNLGVGTLPLYWLLTNGPATLLLATFLARPIRAVGPLVLAFLIAIAIGSQSVVALAAASESLLRAIARSGFAIGLNATGAFIGMIVIGVCIFGALGWPLLRAIGRRYEQKKLSDQSIMLDSLWLLFGVVQSIGLAFEGPLWILTGPVAFVAYKLVSRIGLAWSTTSSIHPPAKTLLLLRVFALGKRSEQLFDKLRKHWQYTGSISMIAGPDLVTTTIEPHEFLEFLSGHLGRQFVADWQDLERRVENLDQAQDPDGRYRINEFFCHNDTWQMTMERLAATSSAVLMDLRSFSPENQGCIFELGRLVDSVDLRRVVYVVDKTTDYYFLESTLQRLSQSMSPDSPNQSVGSPTVRLFRIERQSERELKALLHHLVGPTPSAVAA
jgi:hypothetical protein